MNNCCVEIDADLFEDLLDFLIDSDVDLNTLNIDNLVVNDINCIDVGEDTENFNEDAFIIIRKDNNHIWYLG